MYIITKKQTRKSTNIPFYFEKYPQSEIYQKYFYTNYIESKKFISSSTEYSDDKLTVTKIITWSSRSAFLDFTSDRYCYDTIIDPNRTYDIENDITSDITIEKG